LKVLTVVVAIAVSFALAAPAVARPGAGVTSSNCALYPGDTTITWDYWSSGTYLDLNWYNGSELVEHAILKGRHSMNGLYTHPTPYSATVFTHVSVRNNGEVIGGQGMDCT
jgi:hypothetical protein